MKRSKKALLIVDMINPLDFPEGKQLLRHALPAAKAIQKIKKQFHQKKDPVIYVNDCFGHLKDDWIKVYEHVCRPGKDGAKLCELLPPDEEDYFVLKPKHSGFFGTNLEVILQELEIQELVITGIAGNICVLFTVNDAYMRGYKIHVPEDAIASNSKRDNDYVLKLFSEYFKIKTDPV